MCRRAHPSHALIEFDLEQPTAGEHLAAAPGERRARARGVGRLHLEVALARQQRAQWQRGETHGSRLTLST